MQAARQINPTVGARQTGVGLIEILIAVLVLSIGFLGMAALQAKALANNNSAMARTQAVIAAYSILDAMRADRTNAMAGAYDSTVTYKTDGSCDITPGLAGLAADQVGVWCTGNPNSKPPDGLAALGANPNTIGVIKCDATGFCKIDIKFDDSRGTGNTNPANSQIQIEIRSKV